MNTNLQSQILKSLQVSEEYRRAFTEEKVRSTVAAQIKAIREQRRLDPKSFAEKLGKKLSWVYRLEDPNQPAPTIPTLLEVAKAFDVDLDVRFVPYSILLSGIDSLSPTSFEVPSFEEELSELKGELSRIETQNAFVSAQVFSAADYLSGGGLISKTGLASEVDDLRFSVDVNDYYRFIQDRYMVPTNTVGYCIWPTETETQQVSAVVNIGMYQQSRKGPSAETDDSDYYNAKRA